MMSIHRALWPKPRPLPKALVHEKIELLHTDSDEKLSEKLSSTYF
jgi:hypothetical protein